LEPLEYLRVLRRRKFFVALAVLVGLVAGWVSAPGHTTAKPPNYRATHVLILNLGIAVKTYNVQQSAVLVTSGAVPQAVAAKIGPGTDPIGIASKVHALANPAVGTLDITAVDTDPSFAVALADDFAQGLVDSLSSDAIRGWQDQHTSLQADIDSLQAQIAALDGTFDPKTNAELKKQLASLNSQSSTALARLAQLDAQGPPQAPFSTLESARASLITTSGFKAPDSKPVRALLLGVVGLVLGIGLAFAAERLETRVTTKSSAELAFGLPVVAEVPNLPHAKRHQNELMTATQPAAPFVEAYRGLRTMVLLKALDLAQSHGTGTPDSARGGKVLVVVSPGAGEGKSTTTGHLAALLAEAGNSVLVVSADFRRPRVHELFAVDSAPGLSEVLAPNNPLPLRSLDLSTPVKGVKLLASGAAVDNPAPLLGATVELMRGARPLFDFIIVDTAPLLVANDASELVRAADIVLVVARSSKTSIESCARSAELLERIDAPVMGVVLVGASDMPAAYRYYRYRYYSASRPPTLSERLRRGRKRDAAPIVEAAEPERPEPSRRAAEQEALHHTAQRRRRDHKPRGGDARSQPPMVEEARDRPAAEPEPAPVSGPTNGFGEHEITDESLSAFWQEFKERR
jgi:capsular exopolysaccharide synthesis family protein